MGASGAVVGMQRHGRPAAVQWWWEQHDSVYLMLFWVIIFTRLKIVFNKCRGMFFHTPNFLFFKIYFKLECYLDPRIIL